jgi:hypothetical protein
METRQELVGAALVKAWGSGVLSDNDYDKIILFALRGGTIDETEIVLLGTFTGDRAGWTDYLARKELCVNIRTNIKFPNDWGNEEVSRALHEWT